MEKYTSTKTFSNLPCSHRSWRHKGHCAFIHGYSRSYTFYFTANELNENNFVVDFGSLKELKKWLEHMFDHTLLIDEDDPERKLLEDMHKRGICDLRVLPSCSMEGSAKYVYEYVNKLIKKSTKNRAWCYKVEARENDKNSAIYEV